MVFDDKNFLDDRAVHPGENGLAHFLWLHAKNGKTQPPDDAPLEGASDLLFDAFLEQLKLVLDVLFNHLPQGRVNDFEQFFPGCLQLVLDNLLDGEPKFYREIVLQKLQPLLDDRRDFLRQQSRVVQHRPQALKFLPVFHQQDFARHA